MRVVGNNGIAYMCNAVNRHDGEGAKLPCQDCIPVKRWMGRTPDHCDLCNGPITTTFIDGATRQGPWAIMCPECHGIQGGVLGTGRGQQYDVKTLEKVAG